MNPGDIVRPVPGFDGAYSVTEDGRVYSHARTTTRKGRDLHVPGGWLTPAVNNAGYPVVRVSKNKVSRSALVHRLVAAAWLPPPAPGRNEVNHKDSNRANPRASNLEWCTRSENHRHGWREGNHRTTPAHQEAARRNGKRRLSAESVRHIREALASGAVQRQLAKAHGVSASAISHIHRNRSYAGI